MKVMEMSWSGWITAGDLAEVDFFEVLVDLDGVRRKAWLFLLRLMYSGRNFA